MTELQAQIILSKKQVVVGKPINYMPFTYELPNLIATAKARLEAIKKEVRELRLSTSIVVPFVDELEALKTLYSNRIR